MWEQHCHEQLLKVGFESIGAEWPSCYFPAETKLFLVVYVDDFKLAGPKVHIKHGWSLLRKGLVIEPEKPIDLYLGCNHMRGERLLQTGIKVTTMTYDMEKFLKACVDLYLQLAPKGTRLRIVTTPFVAELENPRKGKAGRPVREGKVLQCSWCKHTMPMSLYPNIDARDRENEEKRRKVVEWWKKAATGDRDVVLETRLGGAVIGVNSGLGGRSATEEEDDFPFAPENSDQPRREVQGIGARVLMKVLYAARLARFDLLRAIGHLTSFITCWDND